MNEIEERDKIRADKRTLIKEVVGHVAAILLIVGFFVVVLASILGYIDISHPAISLAVGSFVGYCAGNIAPVTMYYFGSKPEKHGNEQRNG